MVSAKSCIIFAAENQNTQTMKTTKKENLCRVSDRAFRTIISGVIDSLTGCCIDPFTFKQVLRAVKSYLMPEGEITGLGKKAKPIFERLLPELDRAIRRSATAREAAARRKAAAKPAAKSAGIESETAAQSETPAGSKAGKKSKKQHAIYSFPGVYRHAEILSADAPSVAPRRIKGTRCRLQLPLIE